LLVALGRLLIAFKVREDYSDPEKVSAERFAVMVSGFNLSD
jgi:hypothetical protein